MIKFIFFGNINEIILTLVEIKMTKEQNKYTLIFVDEHGVRSNTPETYTLEEIEKM